MQRAYSLKSVELGGLKLQDPRALVFAPSSDPTDDPATQHLFIVDSGGSRALGGVVEVLLPGSQETFEMTLAETAAPTVKGTLVQTIQMSKFNPPSPDPAGITYRPDKNRLMVSDSEVEEMPIFKKARTCFS